MQINPTSASGYNVQPTPNAAAKTAQAKNAHAALLANAAKTAPHHAAKITGTKVNGGTINHGKINYRGIDTKV
jgi:hypothetical protein